MSKKPETEAKEKGKTEKRLLTLDKRREIMAEIATWKFTPLPMRDPPTMAALALSLEISHVTCRKYIRMLPDTVEQYTEMIRSQMVARSMGSMMKMQEAKTAQAVASGKLVLENILIPEWQKKVAPNAPIPAALANAFSNTPGMKARHQSGISMPDEDHTTLEDKPLVPSVVSTNVQTH